MIHGAVGGTRIDQHQRNESNPEDQNTIYGRLLARLKAAKPTHGIRGVLWHQGENNSGAAAPTGDWDYKSYQDYFVEMLAYGTSSCRPSDGLMKARRGSRCEPGRRKGQDLLRNLQVACLLHRPPPHHPLRDPGSVRIAAHRRCRSLRDFRFPIIALFPRCQSHC